MPNMSVIMSYLATLSCQKNNSYTYFHLHKLTYTKNFCVYHRQLHSVSMISRFLWAQQYHPSLDILQLPPPQHVSLMSFIKSKFNARNAPKIMLHIFPEFTDKFEISLKDERQKYLGLFPVQQVSPQQNQLARPRRVVRRTCRFEASRNRSCLLNCTNKQLEIISLLWCLLLSDFKLDLMANWGTVCKAKRQ